MDDTANARGAMRRKLGQVGLATLLLTTLTLGCNKSAVRQKEPPPDPLLVTKKPVEGKPTPEEAPALARAEPIPPAPPAPDISLVRQRQASPSRPVQLGFESLPRRGPDTADKRQ